MSLGPTLIGPIPGLTAYVPRASFPGGDPCMKSAEIPVISREDGPFATSRIRSRGR